MSPNVLHQELNGRFLEEKGVQLIIKREDLFFPKIPGNKWRKLKYNLAFAQKNGFKHIVSFGGAFSNHLSALAKAGQLQDIKTTGIVRGEAPKELNATLLNAKADGMQLQFVDRASYKKYTHEQNWTELKSLYPEAYFIPEGGTNMLALKGCAEIISDGIEAFDYLSCPVGTGGTIGGILCALNGQKKVLAFPALKGDFIRKDIDFHTNAYAQVVFNNYTVMDAYHFGGYAKHKPELISFITSFHQVHNIPLDPIYTGKMMYGLFDMIKKDYFPVGSTILAIHTGGLQGIAGFNQRFGTELSAV